MEEIAIVSFANSKRPQSKGGMGAVMRYAMREEKTMWEGRRLVSGLNCSPQTAYDDFLTTKLLHRKEDGRLYYHMVQSFPKGEAVPPDKAHEMALRLAEHFKDYEVLVCTHVDREHIHSHFLINSVAVESGKKLHISTPDLEPIRQLNDALCLEYGCEVFQPQKKKTQGMGTDEYHAAAKGESWKWRLINVVDEAMRYARDREEFLELLAAEGYGAVWTPTRKSITYLCPDGKRCRDYKLHDTKYLKEVMEREFAIRAAVIAGGTAGAERAAEQAHGMPGDAASDGGLRQEAHHPAGAHGGDTAQAGRSAGEAGAGERPGRGGESEEASATGWEEEREFLFSAQHFSAGVDVPQMVLAADHPGGGSLARDVVQLGRAVEGIDDVPPVRDSTTMPQPVSRKHRKLAPGQKEDDHPDRGPSMKMQM